MTTDMRLGTPWPRFTGSGGCGGGGGQCDPISEIHISQRVSEGPKKEEKGKGKKGAGNGGKWSRIKERKTENKEKEGRAKTDRSMDPRGEGRSNRS
jgi:hypothetical protein